jgi:hypothetical protein
VPKNELKPVNFVCVLKSGGDYVADYVYRLFDGIQRNFSGDFYFHCLTDVSLNHDCIKGIPLEHNWKGWWSKIELFRPELFKGFNVYFDLDTVILNNIGEFVENVKDLEFGGLRGFNQAGRKHSGGINFASGIMVGHFSKQQVIYDTFKEDEKTYMSKYKTNDLKWKRGDQGFIADVLGEQNIPKIQDKLPNNYIVGKRLTDFGKKQIPEAHILAWSGKPRLHNLNQGWIYDAWSEN